MKKEELSEDEQKKLEKSVGASHQQGMFSGSTTDAKEKAFYIKLFQDYGCAILSEDTLLDFLALKKAKNEDLKAGKYDDLIKKCLDECTEKESDDGFKLLAHVLFSGRRKINGNPYETCLYYLFSLYHPDEKVVTQVINDALNYWKANFKLSYESQKRITTNEPIKKLSEVPEYNSPWELFRISHGGGFIFINEFLAGYSEGYRLDEPELDRGIYVSVDYENRDTNYATLKPIRHFDEPAILNASIDAQYLNQSHNSRQVTAEAVLRSENIKHLYEPNVKIEITKKVRDSAIAQLPVVRDGFIEDLYKDMKNISLKNKIIEQFTKAHNGDFSQKLNIVGDM